MKHSAILLCSAMMLAATIVCCSTIRESDAERAISINTEVRDSLHIFLPDGYEDEYCRIAINCSQLNFKGEEEVFQGRVSFDVRHFPAGSYLLSIDVGNLHVNRRFSKITGSYY